MLKVQYIKININMLQNDKFQKVCINRHFDLQ